MFAPSRPRSTSSTASEASSSHFPHPGTGQFVLYRVVDPAAGTLEQAGVAPKIGSCMGDDLIAEWRSFDTVPVRSTVEMFAPRGLLRTGWCTRSTGRQHRVRAHPGGR